MKKSTAESASAEPREPRPARLLGIAATAAASAMIVVLAVRPIGGHDIGYHLAYGEHFLDTGRIVQTNEFIYTRFDEKALADPDNLGPGCRYDPATATYSFVNANWLSQAAIAAVYRAGGRAGALLGAGPLAGGMVALSLLQAATVAAIFAVLIVMLRRAGVRWHWIAPAAILGALTAHERFALRPELFGYLLLVGQLALLVRPGLGRGGAAGVIGLQVLAVNSHSYFLLGVGLPAAMLADAFLRWLWARTVTRADTAQIRPRLKWLAVATAGAALASLCNPWFLRGAVMPVQTLIAVRKGRFLTLTAAGSQQKLPAVTELSSPLLERWQGLLSTRAYKLAVAVAVVGGLAALARRRWGWLGILAGVTLASLQTRRNIALAGLLAVPLGAMALRDGWGRLAERVRPGRFGRLSWAIPAMVALVATAVAGMGIHSVVTNRLYLAERNRGRFSLGVSEASLPLDAARWISAHRPSGRVFCDYSTSSNLMYFTAPHCEVPVLTNTWAYPPSVLQWVVDCATDPERLRRAVEEYDVGTIVLNPDRSKRPVIEHLSSSPDWAAVEVGPKYVVFLRRKGADADLAAAQEITEANLDVGRHIERIRKADPVPAHALHTGALLLFWMGWTAPAQAMWAECARLDPDFHEATYYLGVCWAKRASAKTALYREHLQNNEAAKAAEALGQAIADLEKAASMMEAALKIKPDYADAKTGLRIVRALLKALRREAAVGAEP